MLQWCSNCQTDSLVLTDKYGLSICRECGCETEAQRPATDSPSDSATAALAHGLDLESGWARIPGEWANAQSIVGEVPEVPLATARFLPASFFEEEARVAELAAQLNENWAEDQLLERIVRLEQTIVVAETIHQALNEPQPTTETAKDAATAPPATPAPVRQNSAAAHPVESTRKRSTPLVRIDSGHVATPEQIRAHQEKMNRSPAQEARDVDFGSSSDAPDGSAVATAMREPQRTQWRVDTGHLSDLPMARPIQNAPGLTNHRLDAPTAGRETTPVSLVGNLATWNQEAKQITGLGLATAWVVQLIIGVALLSSGPLTLWSIWLVAETLGTICLAAFAWQTFLPNRRHPPAVSEVEPQFRPLGPNTRERNPVARENISG